MNEKCELPEFVKKNILLSRDLCISKNIKTRLILLKDSIKLYEFQNKHLVNNIALNETVLGKIKLKFQDDNIENLNSNITFGKYVYQNFEYKKIYILIKCWDKLIVLHRNEGFHLQAEYENVEKFVITNGHVKYQGLVTINFNNVTLNVQTDFQNLSICTVNKVVEEPSKIKTEFFKKLLDKIKVTKTELFVHRSITRKEYKRFKNFSTFGCNYIRSFQIDEKVILSKCGHIWIRLIPDSHLVVGVPLFNNTSSPRLTVLRNIYPFIKCDEDHSDFRYDFQFYQLKQNITESVLQFYSQNEKWTEQSTEHILLPGSFSVLLIKIKLSSIFLYFRKNVNNPLILYYELIIPSDDGINEAFPLQYYVGNLNFGNVLENESNFHIKFSPITMNQDLLAIFFTSKEFCLKTDNSLETSKKFDEIIQNKFQFKKFLFHSINDQNQEEQEFIHSNEFNEEKILFYNNTLTSIWHGSLVIKERSDCLSATFFVSSMEKITLLVEMIASETTVACKNHIQLKDKSDVLNINKFEDSIRQELNEIMNIYKHNTNFIKSFKKLSNLQMQTDIILSEILY